MAKATTEQVIILTLTEKEAELLKDRLWETYGDDDHGDISATIHDALGEVI